MIEDLYMYDNMTLSQKSALKHVYLTKYGSKRSSLEVGPTP